MAVGERSGWMRPALGVGAGLGASALAVFVAYSAGWIDRPGANRGAPAGPEDVAATGPAEGPVAPPPPAETPQGDAARDTTAPDPAPASSVEDTQGAASPEVAAATPSTPQGQGPDPRLPAQPDALGTADTTRASRPDEPGALDRDRAPTTPDRGAAARPDAATAAPRPTFDLVRADPDGSVVIAGSARPGETVRVDIDGAIAATARADARGDFVLLFDVPQDGRGRVLDLVAIGEDGAERRAEGSIVIAPLLAEAGAGEGAGPGRAPDGATEEALAADKPESEAEETPQEETERAQTMPSPETVHVGQSDQRADMDPDAPSRPTNVAGPDPDPRAAAQSAAPALGADPAAASQPISGRRSSAAVVRESAPSAAPTVDSRPSTGAARPVARAPAVLLADPSGVQVLQPATSRASPVDRVIVDVISYAADGAVLLEGRSAPPPPPVDRVQVYLDGAAIDSAPVREDGSWRLPLADVQSGIYTLRVDQLDTSGRVMSRFETPFQREDPVNLARLETAGTETVGQTGIRASVITVQPGYTLWGIATDRYGSGIEYVQIFEANDDQIRDPDLIYPGQIFDLPEAPAPAE